MVSAIHQVEVDKMAQVDIDNAIICKWVCQFIEEKFPHIVYSGCIAHALDLALEDISSLN